MRVFLNFKEKAFTPWTTQPFSPLLLSEEVSSGKRTPGDKAFPRIIPSTRAPQNTTLDTGRTETRTCSDVKAMSLGTAAIPFSLTSGNILKRAISMAYMLDMAPPRGHSSTVTFSSHDQPSFHMQVTCLWPLTFGPPGTPEDMLIGHALNGILRLGR